MSNVLQTPPQSSKIKPYASPNPSPVPSEGETGDVQSIRKRQREDLELFTEGGNLVDFHAARDVNECFTPIARRPRLFSNQYSGGFDGRALAGLQLAGSSSVVTLENCSVDRLPSELWTMIFSYLAFKDVAELRGLCKAFRDAVDDLSVLSVEFCPRGVPCASILTRMVGLKSLTIAHSNLDDQSVRDLCTALKRRHPTSGRFASNVSNICLRGNGITSAGATALAEVVTINRSITSLDVSSNDIGRGGAVAFAEALKRGNNLGHLNLSFNSIGRRGAAALADALRRPKVSPKLESLDLSVNDIRNEGISGIAEALKMHPLQSLSVGGNGITKEGAIHLARGLVTNHSLKVLNLGSNPIGPMGSAAIGAALTKNTHIHSMRLAHCDMEETGATAFARALSVNTTLVELSIYANNIRSTGVTAIVNALKGNKATGVTILDLSVNEIDDQGATQLAALVNIESRISTLDLRGNLIGDTGATDFMAAIATGAHSVRELDISNNMISDDVAADIAGQCRELGLSLVA